MHTVDSPRRVQEYLREFASEIKDHYMKSGCNTHRTDLELALYHAASKGQDQAVKDFIVCGTNVNTEIIVNYKAHTPLSIAIQNRHFEVILALLKANATIKLHRESPPSENPLYIGLSSARFRFVHDLIQYSSKATLNNMLQQMTYYEQKDTQEIAWLLTPSKDNQAPQTSRTMAVFILFLYWNAIYHKAGKGLSENINFSLPQKAQKLIKAELINIVLRRTFIQRLVRILHLDANQWQQYELLPEFPHLLNMLSRLKTEYMEILFTIMYASSDSPTEIIVDMMLVPLLKEASQNPLAYRDTVNQNSFPPLPFKYRQFLEGGQNPGLQIALTGEVKALREAVNNFLSRPLGKAQGPNRALALHFLCKSLGSCFINHNQWHRFGLHSDPVVTRQVHAIFYAVRQDNCIRSLLVRTTNEDILPLFIIAKLAVGLMVMAYTVAQKKDFDFNRYLYSHSSR